MIDASAARNKVARQNTGSITDARDTAAAAAEEAYDAWTQTPGYDAAAARNAAAKAAISLRKDYELDLAFSERRFRRGAVADPPNDPFPIPKAQLTDPRADLNAHLLIDVTPQVTGTTFTYPRHEAAHRGWASSATTSPSTKAGSTVLSLGRRSTCRFLVSSLQPRR